MATLKYDCVIIVYNYESIHFLRICIKQIRKHKHSKINQHIIISEQSSEESYNEVVREFGHCDDITIVKMKTICSGYAIDYIMRYVDIIDKSNYICTIDVDAFPIHNNWLYIPIKLIEDHGFEFVGAHVEVESENCNHKTFESAYKEHGLFYLVASWYRVSKTEKIKNMAIEAGFTSFHKRHLIDGLFNFKNNEWSGWADVGVVAFWWDDKYNKNNNKFTFAFEKCLGVAPKEGRYGVLIDDLLFHFAFSYNHTQVGNQQESLGSEYLRFMDKIKSGNFEVDEIVNSLKPLKYFNKIPTPRQVWDGKRKMIICPSDEINKRIDELKNY